MWVAAFAIGAWWLWWLAQPYCPGYRAKDKKERRICT